MRQLSIKTFQATDNQKIDAESGVIQGVHVATIGEARGHDQWLDSTTLESILAAHREYRNGVKVLLNHERDVAEIVGSLRSFRISEDGQSVLADLHLLKSSPHRDYILELASDIPDTIGLSMTFDAKEQEIDGRKYIRCSRLHSVDLVTEPAATAAFLQAGPVDNGKEVMNPEEVAQAIAAALAPVQEQMQAFAKYIEDNAPKEALEDEEKKEDEGDKEKLEEGDEKPAEDSPEKKEELIANVVRKTLEAIGVNPTKGQKVDRVQPDTTPKTFRQKFDAKVVELGSKNKALSALMKEDPDGYKAARDKGELSHL